MRPWYFRMDDKLWSQMIVAEVFSAGNHEVQICESIEVLVDFRRCSVEFSEFSV